MPLSSATDTALGRRDGDCGQWDRHRHNGPWIHCRCLHYSCFRSYILAGNQMALHTVHSAVHKQRLLVQLLPMLEHLPVLWWLAPFVSVRGLRNCAHRVAPPSVAEPRGRRAADRPSLAAVVDDVQISTARQRRRAAEPLRRARGQVRQSIGRAGRQFDARTGPIAGGRTGRRRRGGHTRGRHLTGAGTPQDGDHQEVYESELRKVGQ